MFTIAHTTYNAIPQKTEKILSCTLIFFLCYLAIKHQINFFWMNGDDGFYAESAHRMNIGQILHKDFHDFHPGLIQFTHLLAFKLFGESIASLRMPLLVIGPILSVISYMIFQSYGRLYALIAAFLAFSFGVVIIINPSSNWYAVTFALVAIYILSSQRVEQSSALLLLVGCMIGICFLYRSLNGAFLGMGCLVYLYGQQKDIGEFKNFLFARVVLTLVFLIIGYYIITRSSLYGSFVMGAPALAITLYLIINARCNTRHAFMQLSMLLSGVILGMLPLLAYHASINNLSNWIYDVVILPATLINLDYVLSVKFHWLFLHIFGALPEVRSPLHFISLSAWLLLVTLPLSTALLLFLGHFSRKTNLAFTDWYNPITIIGIFYMVAALHYEIALYLVWAALPALLGFYVICLKLPNLWRNILVSSLVCMGVAILLPNMAFPMWQQGNNDLLLGRTSSVELIALPNSPGTLVLAHNRNYVELIAAINKLVPVGGTIFAYPASPDINFLSKLSNPTRHPMPGVSVNSEEKLEQITRLFGEDPPNIIVTVKKHHYDHYFHRKLDEFVSTHYVVAEELSDFILYVPSKNISK